MSADTVLQLSEASRRRVHEAYAAQLGAVSAANAAVAVANQLTQAYEQTIAAWLEQHDVDPSQVTASVDLKSGVVTLTPKEGSGGN